MNLSISHLLLLGLLFLVLVGCIYFFLKPFSEEFKIYDLEAFEQVPIHIPPTTAEQAIHTAFSLVEVKSKMTTQHQSFVEWGTAYSVEIYWTATAEKKPLPKSKNNQWHVVFKANVLPNYICDILFTDTGILQGDAEVVCEYDLIK